MIAYGWSYGDLAATYSDLTNCLRQYIDLDRLAYDRHNSLAITRSLLGMGECSDASEDGLPNKRRYGGSDNANHPFKQVWLAQAFEERDISTIMQKAQPLGQFDISMAMQPAQNSGLLISKVMQPAQIFGGSEYIGDDLGYAGAWGELDISESIRPAQISGGFERFEDTGCAAIHGLDSHSNSRRSTAAASQPTIQPLQAYAQSSESTSLESFEIANAG